MRENINIKMRKVYIYARARQRQRHTKMKYYLIDVWSPQKQVLHQLPYKCVFIARIFSTKMDFLIE